MNVLITGGAGLVGSSMCGRLLARGAELLCVDNLTLGTKRHIEPFRSNTRFRFEQWDVSERGWYAKLEGRTFDLVVHLAASSDIFVGHQQPEMDCDRTFATTFETLLAARALEIPNLIFSSSSAVYGADPVVPTPEDSTRMHPISIYGAGKLASEAFISAFAENYGLNTWVFRFGNVVGEKLTHGVIYDFVRKLKANPNELEVLGDGMQSKTYIDVEDCVSGMLHAFERSAAGGSHTERFQIFNLSTDGQTSVREIAAETVRVVTGGKATIRYGNSAIGWIGDVPRTSLDTSRMKALGWAPRLDSRTAVFEAIRAHHAW